MLECITCDKEFKHGELFLAQITDNIVKCSQCYKCVDRIGANQVKEKKGGWANLERVYDEYIIKH